MPSGLQAMKAEQVHYSIRNFGRFLSDQAVIWDEISQKADRDGGFLGRGRIA